jgi:uncharacterized membrane protein YsdA (DUF1294 family)
MYGIDKWKAKHNKWRIPEATLLGLAVVGGSVGAWLGMKVWHHKTMHKKFKYGIPFILMVTVVSLVSRLTDEEPLMALAGICSLIPYYIILYLNRHRMQEKFSFTIEKH